MADDGTHHTCPSRKGDSNTQMCKAQVFIFLFIRVITFKRVPVVGLSDPHSTGLVVLLLMLKLPFTSEK